MPDICTNAPGQWSRWQGGRRSRRWSPPRTSLPRPRTGQTPTQWIEKGFKWSSQNIYLELDPLVLRGDAGDAVDLSLQEAHGALQGECHHPQGKAFCHKTAKLEDHEYNITYVVRQVHLDVWADAASDSDRDHLRLCFLSLWWSPCNWILASSVQSICRFCT